MVSPRSLVVVKTSREAAEVVTSRVIDEAAFVEEALLVTIEDRSVVLAGSVNVDVLRAEVVSGTVTVFWEVVCSADVCWEVVRADVDVSG